MPPALTKKVMVISSMVARGHVGLSAIVPVLQGFACETVSLPTVLLSNHPGHARAAGQPVPVKQLEEMVEALDGNGWLRDVDAVLTGYFPTAAHVSFAASCGAASAGTQCPRPCLLRPGSWRRPRRPLRAGAGRRRRAIAIVAAQPIDHAQSFRAGMAVRATCAVAVRCGNGRSRAGPATCSRNVGPRQHGRTLQRRRDGKRGMDDIGPATSGRAARNRRCPIGGLPCRAAFRFAGAGIAGHRRRQHRSDRCGEPRTRRVAARNIPRGMVGTRHRLRRPSSGCPRKGVKWASGTENTPAGHGPR